jgi:hypothetical protein
MIKKLAYIFGSKTKAQEMVFLMHGLKQVVRQGFFEHELPKIEKYCDMNNLYLVKSKFKVLLADETTFSNKGIRVPEKDKRAGMYFVYLSKDEEKAWLAAYYELMQNDLDLGKLLGYPGCCVNFFVRNFHENNSNPEHQPTNFLTNITKRDEDCVLLSHFPCHSDCENSITIARKQMDLLISLDKERAEEIVNRLKL